MHALRIALSVILVPLIIYLSINGIIRIVENQMRWDFEHANDKTYEAMKATPFVCPPGMHVCYGGYKGGTPSRWCESLPFRQGPYEGWIDCRRRVAGQYKAGKEDGKWTYYDKDGAIEKVEVYDDGVLVETKSSDQASDQPGEEKE